MGIIPFEGNEEEAFRNWGKEFKTNNDNARHLVETFQKHKGLIVVVDDISRVTPTSRPWLEQIADSATVVGATDESENAKRGLKSFWKRFDEVRLGPLNKSESQELLVDLIQHYRIISDDEEIYKRKVLDLAQGSPYELARTWIFTRSRAA